MARTKRAPHADPFAAEDFNEQLYSALRQSPWWLTSLMAHALVIGVFLLMGTTEAAQPDEPMLTVTQPPEEKLDIEEPPDDVEDPAPMIDSLERDPKITEDPNNDPAQDDNDMEFHETYGEIDSDVSSTGIDGGPSANTLVGLAGGGGNPFGGRGGKGDGGGGGKVGKKIDNALDDALEWLAVHQSPDGSWGASDFANWNDGRPVPAGQAKPDGGGKALYDVGVSGLAVCAFLGAGYTNRGTHKYNRVVAMGLRYLKNVQDPEGAFGPRSTQQYIYNHAIAALAMVEAYGMTGSPIFKGSAQRALDFIALSRNPYYAWRYGIKPGDNDTSVTGWMMMALKGAKLINTSYIARGKAAPLVVDESAFDGVKSWLAKVTDQDTGRVGYLSRGSGSARPTELVDRFPSGKTEAMTAVGILARTFAGEDPRKSEMIRKGAALCASLLPTWNESDGSVDMYYWYYGTLAMFQVGGTQWDRWNARIEPAMVESQRKDGSHALYKGSWDPIGPWGADGGRVYSTAMMAMCLEVYYRYDRVFTGR